MLGKRHLVQFYVLVGLMLLVHSSLAQVCNFRKFSVEEGLPQSRVNCIVQDSSGFIWVGTEGGGIARFDSYQFKEYNSKEGLLHDEVNCLEIFRNDLCVGTSRGLSRFDGKSFHPFPAADRKSEINSLLAIGDRFLIIGTRRGIEIFNGEQPTKLITHTELDQTEISTLFEDRDGKIWVGTRNKGLFQLLEIEGEPYVKKITESTGLTTSRVRCIFEDRVGNLWVGSSAQGLYRETKIGFERVSLPDHVRRTTFTSGVCDAEGNIWLGTWGDGLIKYNGEQFMVLSKINGVAENVIIDLFVDQNNNLWIGHFSSGLSLFLGEAFKRFSAQTGLMGENVQGLVIDDQSRVWVGTSTGVTRFENGRPEKNWRYSELGLNMPGALSYAQDGRVWVANYSGTLGYFDNEEYHNAPLPESLKGFEFLSIKNASNGDLWVGTLRNGLLRNSHGVWSQLKPPDEFGELTVWCIYEDFRGQVWFGCDEGVFYFNEQTGLKQFHPFPYQWQKILDIKGDKDGRLFFGTYSKGVLVYDPIKLSFEEINEEKGLVSDLVSSIWLDESNELWVSTIKGVDRIYGIENGNTDQLSIKHYGKRDGIVGVEYNPGTVVKDETGNLWWGTRSGVLVYYPHREKVLTKAPGIILTGLSLHMEDTDWSQYPGQSHPNSDLPQNLELEFDQNHLEFSFACLNFNAHNDLTYEYRLLGYQEEWQSNGESTLATFNRLPPGEYTFQVRAGMAGSFENATITAYSFVIKPPFWQSSWFLTIAFSMLVITASVIMVALYRQRFSYEMQRSFYRHSMSTGRLLILVGALVYPVSGAIHILILDRDHNLFMQQLVVAGVLGLLFLSTYVLKLVKENIRLIVKVGYYFFVLHVFLLCYQSGLGISYTISLILTVGMISMVVNDIKGLFLFSGFFLAVSIGVASVVQNADYHPILFISASVYALVVAYVVIMTRLNLFRRLSFSDNILRNSKNLILASNTKGEIIFASNSFKDVLGYNISDLAGDGWWNLRSNDKIESQLVRNRVTDIAKHGEDEEGYSYETRVKDKEGNDHWIYWLDFSIPGGISIGIGQDVTELKDAEREVRELSLVASKTDNYVIITDSKDQITWVNDAFCRITGYEYEEVIGKNPGTMLRGSETSEKTIQRIIAKTRQEEAFQEEILNYRKDGTGIWLSLNVTPIKNDSGEVEKYITIGNDVTKKKEAEKLLTFHNERLNFMHQTDQVILGATNRKDLIRNLVLHLKEQWNLDRASITLFDLDKEELNVTAVEGDKEEVIERTGLNPSEVINVERLLEEKVIVENDLERQDKRKGNDEKLLAKGIRSYLVIALKVNQQFFGSLNIASKQINAFDEETIELAKEVAQALSRMLHQLILQENLVISNDKLEKRNLEFSVVNDELKQFAHIVSHDLKAPLRAIGSLSNWISKDYGDKFDELGREQMGLLTGRVKRMNDLIEGVMAYSKVGRKRDAKKYIDLNVLVKDVADTFAANRKIRIEIGDHLPTIYGEETRIFQLFQNLVDNAIKYNDKELGIIRINCAEKKKSWQFSVSDNGRGVEKKNFEKIFQIFQTLQARDDLESTGVGLTIVKKIVELHGGKIWLESVPGEGATFYFTLDKTLNHKLVLTKPLQHV